MTKEPSPRAFGQRPLGDVASFARRETFEQAPLVSGRAPLPFGSSAIGLGVRGAFRQGSLAKALWGGAPGEEEGLVAELAGKEESQMRSALDREQRRKHIFENYFL